MKFHVGGSDALASEEKHMQLDEKAWERLLLLDQVDGRIWCGRGNELERSLGW
jgi:hypothetical protein